jgi:hypothetical protein
MKSFKEPYPKNGIEELSSEELKCLEGGNLALAAPFLAIGALAGAGMAIFEFGKMFGDFIYHITH